MAMTDFNPSLYSDIASSSMNMMPTPMYNPFMGGMYYNTNLLGGARLQRQLDSDKVQLLNTVKKKDSNVFYKAIAALSVLATLGFLRFGKGKTQIGKINSSGQILPKLGKAVKAPFIAAGKGLKAIGRGIAYPFKAFGRGCKKAGEQMKKNINKAKLKKQQKAAAGEPKKSWLSKLMFWKKKHVQPSQTPPINTAP